MIRTSLTLIKLARRPSAFFHCRVSLLLFTLDPIPQNPAYHAFADSGSWFGIPNTWNVISNVPVPYRRLLGRAHGAFLEGSAFVHRLARAFCRYLFCVLWLGLLSLESQ